MEKYTLWNYSSRVKCNHAYFNKIALYVMKLC